MSGTYQGGLKAKETNLKNDPNFYANIGRIGGTKSRGGGFSGDPERARIAGAKGGKHSHSTKPKGLVGNLYGIGVDPNLSGPAPKGKLLFERPTVGPLVTRDKLRIEKPRWYEWGKRRQLKRLGIS